MPKDPVLPFPAAHAAHEAWLRARCDAVEADLAEKRRRMAEGTPFAFLRATCFRFAERYPALFPTHVGFPRAPALGDAHLENFGTWRDAEGRLAWGANDLDEVAVLPFPADLVRLAASAILPHKGAREAVRARDVAARILEGYGRGLERPAPFVLDERHAALRDAANPSATERARFWERLDALPEAKPDAATRRALKAALPKGAPTDATALRFAARRAGLGSLGRPRHVLVAEWQGGRVVREAKARLPSCWKLAGFPRAKPAPLAASPHRAWDPWLRFPKALVVRRLAPDSRKLDAGEGASLEVFLEAMGGELANIHATGGEAAALRQALRDFGAAQLAGCAERAAEDVRRDHAAWQRHFAGAG